MDSKHKYISLFLIIFLFIACNRTDDSINIGLSNSESKELLSPWIVNLDKDKVSSVIIGENGVPKPWKVKVDKITKFIPSPIEIYSGNTSLKKVNSAIINNPQITKLNNDSIIICSDRDSSIIIKKEIILYRKGSKELIEGEYTIQNGEAIYIHSKEVLASPKIIKASSFDSEDSKWDFRTLNVEKDLASSHISALYQDSKGNMWLPVERGVCMYDGVNYYHFVEEDGLGDKEVSDIIEDNDGNLWFSTIGGGVFCFNGKGFVNYSTINGLCNDYIYTITKDKKGNLWFCSGWRGFSCYDGGKFINYYDYKENISGGIISSYCDSKGILWFGFRDGGIGSFDGESFKFIPKTLEYFNKEVLVISEGKDGDIWFGTNEGITIYDGESIIKYTKEQGINGSVKDLVEYNGDMWISTLGGVMKFDGESFTSFEMSKSTSLNFVCDLYKDNAGNLWLGTEGNGLKYFKLESFVTFSVEQGLPHYLVNTIIEDNIGNIWFGTPNGISKYDGKSFTNISYLEEYGSCNVNKIFQDSRGIIWTCSEARGLGRYDGNEVLIYLMEQGLSNNTIRDMDEDSNGTIWIATGDGITAITGNEFQIYRIEHGLIESNANSICVDKNDNIWIGTANGLSCFDGGKFTNYTIEQGLIGNTILSIIEDSKGRMWFGTNRGISCLHDSKFTNFTTNNGLVNNLVLSICEVEDNSFWVGTQNGLSYMVFDSTKVYTGDIPQSIDGERAYFYNYGVSDGVKNMSFNNNAVLLDSKNRIWWGGNKYLTMLDLNKFKLPDVVPEVRLVDLKINEKHIDYKQNKDETIKYSGFADFYNYPFDLELPYNLNHLTFTFSALELEYPYHLRYIYKLDGFDIKWNNVTKQNIADYRNIPPGKYTFKVKALGAPKEWSKKNEYSFVIKPPLWLTFWAYLFYVLLGIVILTFILRYRTQKLKKHRDILELKVKERTKVVEEQKEELEKRNDEISQINNSLNLNKKLVEERNHELNEQNEEIVAQRNLLSRQNNEITSSIAYAKKIQNAVLPNEFYIDELLPENFIMFKPKDVVSGDFYWVKQVSNKIIIVAADCTGHGVPGAIMSMLGVSYLNDIVYKREITQANQILNELRKEIKRTLHQTGKNSDARDGMDIALCVLDPKSNKMQYAGAYNPLYIFRKGELIEINADKMPIGVFMNDINTFTNHEIDMQIGDVFYIFSDGFKDQIGGPNNTKYMQNNFKQLLNKMHKKPLAIQKELLEKEHDNWVEGYEQTDDILVMGVRIL